MSKCTSIAVCLYAYAAGMRAMSTSEALYQQRASLFAPFALIVAGPWSACYFPSVTLLSLIHIVLQHALHAKMMSKLPRLHSLQSAAHLVALAARAAVIKAVLPLVRDHCRRTEVQDVRAPPRVSAVAAAVVQRAARVQARAAGVQRHAHALLLGAVALQRGVRIAAAATVRPQRRQVRFRAVPHAAIVDGCLI